MKVGDKIYSGITHIGTVEFIQFEEGKPGDFSIITMEGNHTSDAQSKDGTVSFVSHGVYNASEIGTKVMKYTENSGFAVAEITQINALTGLEMSDGVVNIANLTITKITSGEVLPGDSGGGVFHKFGDGRYYFCGTMSGSDNIIMAFSPVSLIPLGIHIDYV